MSKRIVIISDTQIPYDDRRALRALIRFIGDTQPDKVIHIGDLMDYPTPSRWSKGSAEEFSLLMREHNEQAKRRLLAPLRDVYDGPIGVHEGNHDERPRVYLSRYAPALAEYSEQFHIENLLDFEEFGVDRLPVFNRVAPGWITTHGHLGQISLSRIPGATALNAAIRFDTSVIMGHTHRMAVLPATRGYGGEVKKVLYGMEVGHLMDQRKAHYLKGATGNWQLGFGLLTVESRHVKAEAIPVNHGRFVVDGRVWEV